MICIYHVSDVQYVFGNVGGVGVVIPQGSSLCCMALRELVLSH